MSDSLYCAMHRAPMLDKQGCYLCKNKGLYRRLLVGNWGISTISIGARMSHVWMVEVKIGKVWDWLPETHPTRSDARWWCRKTRTEKGGRLGEYRVRKYQRVEP